MRSIVCKITGVQIQHVPLVGGSVIHPELLVSDTSMWASKTQNLISETVVRCTRAQLFTLRACSRCLLVKCLNDVGGSYEDFIVRDKIYYPSAPQRMADAVEIVRAQREAQAAFDCYTVVNQLAGKKFPVIYEIDHRAAIHWLSVIYDNVEKAEDYGYNISMYEEMYSLIPYSIFEANTLAALPDDLVPKVVTAQTKHLSSIELVEQLYSSYQWHHVCKTDALYALITGRGGFTQCVKAIDNSQWPDYKKLIKHYIEYYRVLREYRLMAAYSSMLRCYEQFCAVDKFLPQQDNETNSVLVDPASRPTTFTL